MANYRFPQFNLTIDNPSVEVVNVSDSINTQTCSVDVLLSTDTAQFGVNFPGFTYSGTWEDQEVIDWVNNVELPKYAI